ncbi:hypothetical protein, partial [Xanthomonas graminis]
SGFSRDTFLKEPVAAEAAPTKANAAPVAVAMAGVQRLQFAKSRMRTGHRICMTVATSATGALFRFVGGTSVQTELHR